MRKGKNIYKRKDGRWEGRFIADRDASGKAKYRSVYGKSYTECVKKLDNCKKAIRVPRNPMTVSELFIAWHEGRKNAVKPSTYMNYNHLYRLYIAPRFAHMHVNRLTTDSLNEYVSELLQCGGMKRQGLSAKTVQTILIMVKAMFRYGEITHQLHNPAKNVFVPKSEVKEPEVFTRHEIKKIRETAMQRDASAFGILLCLYCGLRIGELCALTWQDIDLTAHTLKIKKTMQRIQNPDDNQPKTVVIIGKPKSAKSIRTVPIPKFMWRKLSELKKKAAVDSFFLTGSDRYIEPRAYRYHYKKLLSTLKIPYRNFHVTRHTFGTECIACGIDAKTVSELLGHASVKITLERYVHTSLETKRKQIEKLCAV